jgi:hypothetical protein
METDITVGPVRVLAQPVAQTVGGQVYKPTEPLAKAVAATLRAHGIPFDQYVMALRQAMER